MSNFVTVNCHYYMKKILFHIFLISCVSLGAQNKPQTISFSEIQGIQIGNAQDRTAKTGVTVFYFPDGATAAVSVLGGGPSSRETGLIDPERNSHILNALVFAGGSSFGLEASNGVMRYLEEQGIGYETGASLVPLVCQSDIYDLFYGRSDVRPDREMGYDACADAFNGNHPISGNVGAGTGATVGKPKGMKQAQKSGIGYAAARLGDLVVGVATVVNAYGDIYYKGRKIAGMTNEDRSGFLDSSLALYDMQPSNLFTGNTTLVAVFTNGDFTTTEMKKVANMAAAGMARAINPVFTMADGDTMYALSIGAAKVKSDVNVAGTLAAELTEEAIKDAICSSAISDKDYLSNLR